MAAFQALVATFDPDQRRRPAFRAARPGCAYHGSLVRFRTGPGSFLSDMAFDNLADRRQQGRDVAPLHPGAAARVEHRLQFFGHEGYVATRRNTAEIIRVKPSVHA